MKTHNRFYGHLSAFRGTNWMVLLEISPVFHILLFFFLPPLVFADCLGISDAPLETKILPAPPIIMFVLDNSGSMDWEVMTDQADGKFDGEIVYIFDDPGDNNFPAENNHGTILSGADRGNWKSQWAGHNRIYYNPAMVYKPWPTLSNADTAEPRSNPINPEITFNLAAEYFPLEDVVVTNAHYYTWDDADGDGKRDSDEEVYLVNFVGEARHYYRFTDLDGDDIVEPGELIWVSELPAGAKPKLYDEQGRLVGYKTDADDLQNFANWYSYYRRRALAAKAAVAGVISSLSGVQIGFYSLNGALRQTPLPVKVDLGGSAGWNDQADTLLTNLYSLESDGLTPLRKTLEAVGQYLHKDDGKDGGLGNSPYATAAGGGACQQSFAVVMTDGYYNGDDPAVGNQDGNEDAPYADSYANTLADVAMKYYKEDLASSLPDAVPINACDMANHQHLVTYTIAFGVTGTLTPADGDGDGFEDDPCFLNGSTAAPSWPDPHPAAAYREKIDDLWHAAVNGRGAFYRASNPQELIDSLKGHSKNMGSRVASGAAVSVNSDELDADTVSYLATFDSSNWTGDLTAHPLNPETGEVLVESDDLLWRASDQLQAIPWNERRIVTYNGTSAGVPFQFGSLTAAQKTALDPDAGVAEEIVAYIRGREIPGFRDREQKLGDIVHSAPRLIGNTIFVGANDGMLHAFNALNGTERFAYIPNLVFQNLRLLKENVYEHRFFVDLTPVVAKNVGPRGMTLLVGGLGKGGKGYYALDVTRADSVNRSFSETILAEDVLWEYPISGTTDSDIGYSYSRAFIVKSYSRTCEWVIVFGNGYDSTNGHAVLYVMDLDGDVIKKMDTGASGCNGLSTPSLVDVNGDFKIDYAYAGDLKGNLWKFDLTDPDTDNWDVAFNDGSNPAPLFQAVGQPITTKPDVMRHITKHGYIVVFGTGKYLTTEDRSSKDPQTIYGVWDYGDDEDDGEYLGAFNGATGSLSNQSRNVKLLEQTQIDARTVLGHELRTLSRNTPTWETIKDSNSGQDPNPGSQACSDGKDNDGDGSRDEDDECITVHAGWYFTLPTDGERVIADPIIRDGRVVFVSATPTTSPCAGGGNSIIHELDAMTGGGLGNPQLDIDDDRLIDSQDLIDTGTEQFNPTGLGYTGILHSPAILRMPSGKTEMKLFSSSTGTTERLFEVAERRAISYWIER